MVTKSIVSAHDNGVWGVMNAEWMLLWMLNSMWSITRTMETWNLLMKFTHLVKGAMTPQSFPFLSHLLQYSMLVFGAYPN